MNLRVLFLVAVSLAASSGAHAEPKQLKGSEFVTVMSDNTLQATSKAGVKFKAYFLKGGIATYEDEKGVRDHGRWEIRDGDQVCGTWKKIDDGRELCARVYTEGNELIWRGENVSGEGKLLGSVR